MTIPSACVSENILKKMVNTILGYKPLSVLDLCIW